MTWNGSGIGNGTTLTQKEIPVVPLNTLCLLIGLNYTATAAAVPTITIILLLGQWCLYNLSRGLVIHATQQRKEQSAHTLQINRDLLPGLWCYDGNNIYYSMPAHNCWWWC